MFPHGMELNTKWDPLIPIYFIKGLELGMYVDTREGSMVEVWKALNRRPHNIETALEKKEGELIFYILMGCLFTGYLLRFKQIWRLHCLTNGSAFLIWRSEDRERRLVQGLARKNSFSQRQKWVHRVRSYDLGLKIKTVGENIWTLHYFISENDLISEILKPGTI
jgi:hypothetical protein